MRFFSGLVCCGIIVWCFYFEFLMYFRYYFLVYNASVIYWQFSRIFLKPNYKRFLAKSLHQVVKALDDIDDEDYEWRAQLMM